MFTSYNDKSAQYLLDTVSSIRTDVQPNLHSGEVAQILSTILGKIETAVEQYWVMTSYKRCGMTKHLRLYKEVLMVARQLAIYIMFAEVRFGDQVAVNQYVRQVVEGFNDIDRGIPLPGVALDKTYDPHGIENTLFNQYKVKLKTTEDLK
ncbi:hypothetical protein FRC00_005292 [Tulasnella sp. 408]|nr:hypothetical protein FRC00_005292 [Tulasnella sp. 408]